MLVSGKIRAHTSVKRFGCARPTLCKANDSICFTDWERFLNTKQFNVRELFSKLNKKMLDEGSVCFVSSAIVILVL